MGQARVLRRAADFESSVTERKGAPVDHADHEPTADEPAYLVHGMDRDEAISFGRVFRQNTILYAQNGRPELIVTDPTADDIGRTFQGNWRVRT